MRSFSNSETSRVALRLGLEAAAIPGVAVTLLLDALIGGAMMHALITPA